MAWAATDAGSRDRRPARPGGAGHAPAARGHDHRKILSALSADSRLRPLVSAPSDPVPGCPSFHRKMRELTVRLRPSFVEQRGRCVDAFACAARGDRDGDGSVRVLAGESGRVKQCATQARQQKAETAETGRAKTETEAETSTSQRTTRAPVCPRAIYTPSGVGCVQPGTLQSRCGRQRRPSSPGRGTPFVAGPRDRACTSPLPTSDLPARPAAPPPKPRARPVYSTPVISTHVQTKSFLSRLRRLISLRRPLISAMLLTTVLSHTVRRASQQQHSTQHTTA